MSTREKGQDKEGLLQRAYQGATPLEKKERAQKRRRVRIKAPHAEDAHPHMAHGSFPKDNFRLTVEDDFVKGSQNGQNLRKLKRELKDFRSHEGNTLDLHGDTRAEAEGRLRRFLGHARSRNLGQVLVIFGKGTHSPDGMSRLRDLVLSVLQEPGTNAFIRATFTAPQKLGGTGALLVVLARAPRA